MKKIILLTSIISTILFAEIKPNHLMYGIEAECDQVVKKNGYVNCYNHEERGPNFIQYNLTDGYLEKKILDTEILLLEDKEIEKQFRNTAEDYLTLKGLLPTKLKSSYSSSVSLKNKKDSSLFSNTVPMRDSVYNVWEKTEDFEKKLVKKYKTIHVVSGVTYQKRDPKREGMIGIPEYFYKIYFSPSTSKMLGLIIPHSNLKTKRNFYGYSVPVTDIEALTGNKFFPKLEEGLAKRIKRKIVYF